MSDSKFHAGQTVIHTSHGDREVVIERVARKYAYVRLWGRNVAFDKATGQPRGDFDGYIETLEDHADRQQRTKLLFALRDRGVYLQAGNYSKFSTVTVGRILAAIEESDRG